jgi:hypothetical protein
VLESPSQGWRGGIMFYLGMSARLHSSCSIFFHRW